MIAATEAMTVESGKSGRASTDGKDTHVTKFDDDEVASTVQMMMVKERRQKSSILRRRWEKKSQG